MIQNKYIYDSKYTYINLYHFPNFNDYVAVFVRYFPLKEMNLPNFGKFTKKQLTGMTRIDAVERRIIL